MGDRGSAVRGKWAEIFRGGDSYIEEKKIFLEVAGGIPWFGRSRWRGFPGDISGRCF